MASNALRGNSLCYNCIQMFELVADCPRCGTRRITFDLTETHYLFKEYGWIKYYEAFCVCRKCQRSTVFVLTPKHRGVSIPWSGDRIAMESAARVAVNLHMNVKSFVNISNLEARRPPEHLPKHIEAAFKEGAICLSVGCFNAAAAMFRLSLDLATKDLLPNEEVDGLDHPTRHFLARRLKWLFDNNKLSESLRELSSAVKDEGNDGAHDGSLDKNDADDLVDFAEAFLERLYTEPEKLRLAEERRKARRADTSDS